MVSRETALALQEAGLEPKDTVEAKYSALCYSKERPQEGAWRYSGYPNQVYIPSMEHLWELLPAKIKHYWLRLEKEVDAPMMPDLHTVEYVHNGTHKETLERISHHSAPEALARLLLWCIQNGHTKL